MGEEHTGYVLEVEVDISAVQDTEELVNGQVAITGSLEFVDYPGRGKELVFKATSAAAIEEEGTKRVKSYLLPGLRVK
jgi:hypothetical protein